MISPHTKSIGNRYLTSADCAIEALIKALRIINDPDENSPDSYRVLALHMKGLVLRAGLISEEALEAFVCIPQAEADAAREKLREDAINKYLSTIDPNALPPSGWSSHEGQIRYALKEAHHRWNNHYNDLAIQCLGADVVKRYHGLW